MLARSILIWLALSASAIAQTIGGLSTLQPLSEGRYPVAGMEVPGGSIDELAKWAGGLVVAVDGPAGAETSIEVDLGLVKRLPTIYFSADKAGMYVLAIIDTKAKSPKLATKRVQVGEVAPPSPNPPTPGPTPTPAPIPLDGLRVMVIYETDPSTTTMTRSQSAIVTGAETRAMLTSRCAKDSKGNPEFRFFDVDADMANSAQHWRDAMKRPRDKLPWLIVSDGKNGYEGPLPDSAQAFAELLKGYGQ